MFSIATTGTCRNVDAVTTQTVTQVTRPAPLHAGRGTLLIVFASLSFGASGPLAKPAMDAGLSPQEMVSARIGLAALVLLAVVALWRPALLRVHRSQWRLLVGYGLVGVAGVQLFYFGAVARIPIGVAMLLEFTSPVLVALWVRFVRRVVLPARMWVGTVLAVVGLAMVAQVWDGLRLDAIGLLLGAGAALCSAAYFIVGESLTNIAKHSGATEAKVNAWREERPSGDLVIVEITDDGQGGATMRAGGGLAGLADRAATIDGVMTVVSPVGGPTVIRADLPCVW